jgi:hypothetical protein
LIILSFGHKAQRGKDTLAEFLIRTRGKSSKFGFDIRRYAHADNLKREVSNALLEAWRDETGNLSARIDVSRGEHINAALALTRELGLVNYIETSPDLTDPLCPYGKFRRLLQWWGTEYRRAQNPDYWVNSMWATIESEEPGIVLLTDTRFPNEFAAVKERGGWTIHLERPGFSLGTEADKHPSETALDDAVYDYSISQRSVIELQMKGIELFDSLVTDAVSGQVCNKA